MSFRRLGRAACAALAASALLALSGASAVQEPAPAASSPLSRLHVDRFENGLTLAALPADEPDRIILATIIRAGRRNETEPGTEGLSRLIARLADRAPAALGRGPAPAGLAGLGARAATWTGHDAIVRTVAFMGREKLEDVLRSEADRLINLDIGPESLRREAAAMAAEAAAAAADPDVRIEEALGDASFPLPPGGTASPALGSSPELPAEAARLFKQRFFAPDHAVLLIMGDIVPERVAPLVRRYYGGWEKSNFDLAALLPPENPEPLRSRIAWAVPTRARIAIGFRTPPSTNPEQDAAALEVLAVAAFSPASPLFDRLVRREGKALGLEACHEARRDGGFFAIKASAATEDGLPAIETAIREEIDRLKTELLPAAALAAARSGLQRSLLLSLETGPGKAAGLARMIGRTGDPASLSRLLDLYGRIGAADLREAARLGLRSAASATILLAPGAPPAPPTPEDSPVQAERS